MGYTLYWNYRKPNDKEKVRTSFSPEFKKKVQDAIKVASSHGITLGDWDGDTLKDEPLTDTVIRFNGSRPNCCETFNLTACAPQGYWDCCKTNWNSYTVLCMEILQLALEDGILENWSTDGNDQELKDEWHKLYKRNSNEGEQTWEEDCTPKNTLDENN